MARRAQRYRTLLLCPRPRPRPRTLQAACPLRHLWSWLRYQTISSASLATWSIAQGQRVEGRSGGSRWCWRQWWLSAWREGRAVFRSTVKGASPFFSVLWGALDYGIHCTFCIFLFYFHADYVGHFNSLNCAIIAIIRFYCACYPIGLVMDPDRRSDHNRISRLCELARRQKKKRKVKIKVSDAMQYNTTRPHTRRQ